MKITHHTFFFRCQLISELHFNLLSASTPLSQLYDHIMTSKPASFTHLCQGPHLANILHSQMTDFIRGPTRVMEKHRPFVDPPGSSGLRMALGSTPCPLRPAGPAGHPLIGPLSWGSRTEIINSGVFLTSWVMLPPAATEQLMLPTDHSWSFAESAWRGNDVQGHGSTWGHTPPPHPHT